MWKIVLCSICTFIVPSVLHAQAVPTAIRRSAIQVGIGGTSFSLDYGEGREEGIIVYGTIDLTSHLGAEALYRNASIVTPRDIGNNDLMIGPRVHFQRGRFSPYAKVLIGRSTINFQQGYNPVASSQSYLSYSFGGGVDFHLKRHINLRLFDYEYQRWPNFPPHGLTPSGFSAGVAYAF